MMETCRCALAVLLDYTGFDVDQTRYVQQSIDKHGEWTTVVNLHDGIRYRVSRHCIALHGIVAAQIADYGFEQVSR